MIRFEDPYFVLETRDLHYICSVLPTGQLEHLYLGKRIKSSDYQSLHTKITSGAGSTIDYINDKGSVPIELIPLEYSGIGKGDFRLTPLELKMPDGTYVNDFVYEKHEIINGIVTSQTLPVAQAKQADAQSLIITMIDRHGKLQLDLIYTVFEQTNVFTRRAILTNHHQDDILIRKMMSMMIDIESSDYDLITLDGGWIKEAHVHKRPLSFGTYINDSVTGNSSNRHNPGIILAKKDTREDVGVCIGINLVYSGNHYEAVQVNAHGTMRVMTGINPHCFEWPLKHKESFETPESVITYADQGFNELSHHMHSFVNEHIIPETFQKKARPVVINSWEAFYFDFNRFKLAKLARQAKRLGVELFVLDDGWFGKRNDDTTSLGDYEVNQKKLRGGLFGLHKRLNRLGLSFGLWFEPEMVSEKSQLYHSHPEYAVTIKGRIPALGRHQLVLDLCQSEVRSYIKQNVTQTIKTSGVSYIKWDMNRHITDAYSPSIPNQGMFFHRYILGLYDILNHIRTTFPDILIETCASGGNRFDLGMLSYGAQIWASDDTDPIERLSIQEGLSYLYPLSAISSHVSMSPHSQTLRQTPLSTRFNVSSFGVLGYELNLKYLSPLQKKEIRRHIDLYKTYRHTFQFGRFYRFDSEDKHQKRWQVSKDDVHILGNYQTLSQASPFFETVSYKDLDKDATYHVKSVKEIMSLDRFGHLISHALPIKLHPDGWIMRWIKKHYGLTNGSTETTVSGELLMHGMKLKQRFMGTNYHPETRIMGDYGSEMLIAIKQA